MIHNDSAVSGGRNNDFAAAITDTQQGQMAGVCVALFFLALLAAAGAGVALRLAAFAVVRVFRTGFVRFAAFGKRRRQALALPETAIICGL